MFSVSLLIYILLCLFGFMLMRFTFTPIIRKYSQTLEITPMMLPFGYVLMFYAVGAALIYFLLPSTDFVVPLTAVKVFLPIVLAGVIFISSMFFSQFLWAIIVTICVAAMVFIQQYGEGFLYPILPMYGTQICLTIFFSVFCIFFGVLNLLPQTMLLPAMIMLFGLSALTVLGAYPVNVALLSGWLLSLIGGYISLNFYTIKIPFDNGSGGALAYLVCSLMLLNVGEYSFSSCLVLTTIFWAEIFAALWNKYISGNNGHLYENTNYALAADKYTMYTLMLNICKIGMVVIFISGFQLFAVNQYSLFIVCFAIVLWLNRSFVYPSKKMTFSEMNKNFVADVKQNISEVKKSIDNLQNAPQSSQKKSRRSDHKSKKDK